MLGGVTSGKPFDIQVNFTDLTLSAYSGNGEMVISKYQRNIIAANPDSCKSLQCMSLEQLERIDCYFEKLAHFS